MRLKDLKNKKILILGLGREGVSSLTFFLNKLKIKKITVADQLEYNKLPKRILKILTKYKDVEFFLGRNYLNNLDKYDVIIKTPGIPPFLETVKRAQKMGTLITSQTEIFFNEFTGKIIGITGTKGKSTTTTLIYKILKKAGFNASLGANIGKPSMELLGKKIDWAVLELSSHQLWNLRKSPHVAVFLNFYPEHLDYSPDLKTYFKAKQNIALYQKKSDHFIYNQNFSELKMLARKIQSKIYPYDCRKSLATCCFMKNDSIFFQKNSSKREVIIKTSQLALKSPADKQNVQAAIVVAKILGIKTKIIKKVLTNFKPLKGRLQKIGTFSKITFYDDCLATIPQATINALTTFEGKVGSLFLGGWERKQNFSQVIDAVIKQKIPIIILFPPTDIRIRSQIKGKIKRRKIIIKTFLVHNMKEAVETAYKYTKRGTISLFSTGAPSFGLYKSYYHRSQRFSYWVKKLARDVN